jgi:hypothetical protein
MPTHEPARATSSAITLRVYLHEDYLVLYSVAEPVVYLLSIRHHK